MSTYREFAYSIQQQIKQTFDDASVTIPHIVFYINMVGNRMMYERVRKTNSSRYLVYFPDVPVQLDTTTGRKYSVLPSSIFDLNNDSAIDTISYAASEAPELGCGDPLQNPFNRSTAKKSSVLYGNPYRKPSASNVYYFPVQKDIGGENLFVAMYAGLECTNATKVDMYVICLANPGEVCDLDSDLPFPADMEKNVYYEVLNLVRFGFMMPEDKKNDGSDTAFAQGATSGRIQPVQQEQQDAQQQQETQ